MLRTTRLDLIQASPESVQAAIDDRERFSQILNARIPDSWPPEHLDTPALEWILRWLADPANDHAFSAYWMVLRESANGRVLIGIVGYKGMPKDGVVEIGYGVAEEYRRQGYATEGSRALIAHAFARADVDSVAAETYPDHVPSLGVMQKCRMKLIGDGSEPGVVRYAVTRADYS